MAILFKGISGNMKAMVVTVGTGHGVESGILASIKQNNPDYIIFLTTEKGKETLQRESLRAEINKRKCDVRIIENENDAEKCYKTAKEMIKKLKDEGYSICVDFTSGTKAMTGGIVLAAIIEETPSLVYVTGERDKNGRVIPHTERVYSIPSPTEVIVDFKKKLLAIMFNNCQFYDCLSIINEVKSSIIPKKLEDYSLKKLEIIVNAYYLWDLFEHEKAFNELNKIKVKEIADLATDVTQLGKNKEFLGILTRNKEDKFLLVDIICNAKRRMNEGKFDDAVARLYRAIEFIGQIALKDFGVDVKDFSLEALKKLPIGEEKKGFYEKFAEDGKIRIGVRNIYRLLDDLGSEIGKRFKEDKELHNLLTNRNKSILAHGNKPVEKEDAQKLYRKVLEYAEILFKDIDVLMKKAEFIKLKG